MRAVAIQSRFNLAILALAVVGLLAGILSLAPLTQASGPKETLTGTYKTENLPVGVNQRGSGVLMLDLQVTAEFLTGGIEGTIVGPAIGVLQPGGGFTLHAQGFHFDGKINGREGTAKVNATAHGVADPNITGCCFQAAVQFYQGTGGLEGLSATGVLTFDPINGRTYSMDVHFK